MRPSFSLRVGPTLLPLPLEFFLHCVTCHSSAFKGEAELCTLRFVGLFSGLACFLFNHTESSAHSTKLQLQNNLHLDLCLIRLSVKTKCN